MGDEAGEAGTGAPEQPLGQAVRRRLVAAPAEPAVQREQDRNSADDQQDRLVVDPAGNRRADAEATYAAGQDGGRSEEQPSELPSLMRNTYSVFCMKKKKTQH